MVSLANRTRAADVLLFAVLTCGLVSAVAMLVGRLAGFDATGVSAGFVFAGMLLSMAAAWVYSKGIEDASDRNFRAMLADVVFLLLMLIGFALSDWPWSWLAVAAYLGLLIGGVCLAQFENSAFLQWAGLAVAVLGLAVAVLVMPFCLPLYTVIAKHGLLGYLLSLLPVFGYAFLLGRRIYHGLND